MLRVLLSAATRGTTRAVLSTNVKPATSKIPLTLKKLDPPTDGYHLQARYFSLLCKTSLNRDNIIQTSPSASSNILQTEAQLARVPVRTLIKFTRYKGKRQTVSAVPRRFFRLHWGMWIRTKAGRHSKLWRKSLQRKRRLARHVFTTPSQSHLLDTLVSKYWRRPKYWVDDPYNPYHMREEFPWTRKNPRIPF